MSRAVRVASARTEPDSSYRTLLGHTTVCPSCRALGGLCPTAARLVRAWRKDRR